MLTHALTHRSYCAENDGTLSNERLEFLGDAVVGLAVTDYIFENYPELAEGELAKLRASVVNTVALARQAQSLNLGPMLRLGIGEDRSGGRTKESILADVFEAVIGALFVDRGWEKSRDCVIKTLAPQIREGALVPGGQDYKTRLQELTALLNMDSPVYEILGSGPDHARIFTAKVSIGEVSYGAGSGTSKKRAEQDAAQLACGALQEAVDHQKPKNLTTNLETAADHNDPAVRKENTHDSV